MPDLSTASIDLWLAQHGSTAMSDASIGPESHLDVLPAVTRLGTALEGARNHSVPETRSVLGDDVTIDHLKTVMAQIGPARRLRLLFWLADSGFNDPREIVDRLTAASPRGVGPIDPSVVARHATSRPAGRNLRSRPHQHAARRLPGRSRTGVHLMSRATKPIIYVAAVMTLLLGSPMLAHADDTSGCTTLAQAAAAGIAARVSADDQTIKPPQSVTTLSCLDGFFNGLGLNLITNLLNPATLLTAVKGQICAAVNSTWQSFIGGAQCGLTVTGFNVGFGGLGGGLLCPKLSFGGGGASIGSIGTNLGSGQSGQYLSGTGIPPTGYTLPTGTNY